MILKQSVSILVVSSNIKHCYALNLTKEGDLKKYEITSFVINFSLPPLIVTLKLVYLTGIGKSKNRKGN